MAIFRFFEIVTHAVVNQLNTALVVIKAVKLEFG